LQAMVQAHRARSAGDHKKYHEVVTYLQQELGEPEHQIIALINDNASMLHGDTGSASVPTP